MVRKISEEVSRRVAWMWRVVCGVRGSGKHVCLGWRLGWIETTPGAAAAAAAAAAASSPCWSGMTGAGMMGFGALAVCWK